MLHLQKLKQVGGNYTQSIHELEGGLRANDILQVWNCGGGHIALEICRPHGNDTYTSYSGGYFPYPASFIATKGCTDPMVTYFAQQVIGVAQHKFPVWPGVWLGPDQCFNALIHAQAFYCLRCLFSVQLTADDILLLKDLDAVCRKSEDSYENKSGTYTTHIVSKVDGGFSYMSAPTLNIHNCTSKLLEALKSLLENKDLKAIANPTELRLCAMPCYTRIKPSYLQSHDSHTILEYIKTHLIFYQDAPYKDDKGYRVIFNDTENILSDPVTTQPNTVFTVEDASRNEIDVITRQPTSIEGKNISVHNPAASNVTAQDVSNPTLSTDISPTQHSVFSIIASIDSKSINNGRGVNAETIEFIPPPSIDLLKQKIMTYGGMCVLVAAQGMCVAEVASWTCGGIFQAAGRSKRRRRTSKAQARKMRRSVRQRNKRKSRVSKYRANFTKMNRLQPYQTKYTRRRSL